MTRYGKMMLRAGLAAMAMGLAGSASAATITGLFNTGTDAAGNALAGGDGVIDPHYRIQSTTDGIVGAQAVTFRDNRYGSDDATSRWVSLTSNGYPGRNTTIYRTTFSLAGFIASTAQVTGRFGADNIGRIIFNGVDQGIRIENSFGHFLPSFSLTSGFLGGLNTLDFLVEDGPSGPPTALHVAGLAGTADLTNVAGVPEPSAWALMIAGFGLTGAAMRRRRTLTPGFA
jgi:PEP-CTERM motif